MSEVISTWITNNSCEIDGVVEENVPDLVPEDNSTVSKFIYNSCTLTTDVHLYKVTGGGHTWPGASIERPELGVTNKDIKASAIIWQFFKTHRNVNLITSTDEEPENEVFIYPAIFEDSFEVRKIPEGSKISLYSYSGRLLSERTDSDQAELFQARELAPGVYIVHIQFPQKGHKSLRIVKL